MPPLSEHIAATRERLRASGLTRPGPGSVCFKVNREIVVVAGWGRAVLLQLAHPLVAAAVDTHSSVRSTPLARAGRARSTVQAMLALTFGGDEQAIAAAAHINTVHDRIRGTLDRAAGVYAAGETYSAHDAELLRWVHATLLDSILRAYERLVGPLTAEERRHYCVEATVMEPLLGIPAGLLPRDAQALEATIGESFGSGRIVVTDRARALARALLFPPQWRLAWPVFRPIQLLTIGDLPAPVRDAYGFPWGDPEARALARWTAALTRLRGLAPAALREWPAARVNVSGRARARSGARPRAPEGSPDPSGAPSLSCSR